MEPNANAETMGRLTSTTNTVEQGFPTFSQPPTTKQAKKKFAYHLIFFSINKAIFANFKYSDS
jgi:hypothetical protein